jgi:hypothetical protein
LAWKAYWVAPVSSKGLAYELHKSYRPFFKGAGGAEKVKSSAHITRRIQYLADGYPRGTASSAIVPMSLTFASS